MNIKDLSFCVELTEEDTANLDGGDDFSDFFLSEDEFFPDDEGFDGDFVTLPTIASRNTQLRLYRQGLANMMNSFYV